jgi:hypothetical protein
LLTYSPCRDRTTRWPEVFFVKSTTGHACVNTLVQDWVCRFGAPEDITSYSRPPVLFRGLGSPRQPPGHQAAQDNSLPSLGERFSHSVFIRKLKDSLYSRGSGLDWAVHLPWVFVKFMVAPEETSSLSSVEAFLGAPLSLPGEFIRTPETSVLDLITRFRSGSAKATSWPRSLFLLDFKRLPMLPRH